MTCNNGGGGGGERFSDLIMRGFKCNSYPRSCHMEADAQVTLKALCLLHNTPGSTRKKERLIHECPFLEDLMVARCHS